MARASGPALETYRAKRDFRRSPEPSGTEHTEAPKGIFVVQKHAARRLHYDFRLEMGGVLKSWAVTRGPSLDPGDKRLAVHVEDHPLDYGSFEGTIPKGEYGGGTVLLWDRGPWTPVGDAKKGYAKGHLEFELAGAKLKGRWHLVRLAGRPGETRDNWLLIKADDTEARTADRLDIQAERPESVATGRTIDEIAGEKPGWSSKTGRLRKQATAPAKTKTKGSATDSPAFVAPTLATAVAAPPKGSRWLHEIKYDGYRIQASVDEGRVTLFTRTGLDWTSRFGTAVTASLSRLPAKQALLDGELVVEAAHGGADFSALQLALSENRTANFRYYAFDLLHCDGQDLTKLPLTRRRERLERLMAGAEPPLALSGLFTEDGGLILKHACRLSLEGIVSKRKTAPYRSGRGKDWVKSKCARREEFVVGGFMPSATARDAVGSLVLGMWNGDAFTHVGRVGTGFTARLARDLHAKLQPLRRAKSPFSQTLTADEARGVVYVEPDLVAEVEYRAWTADHHLRHAAFRGLREDKPAREVVREDRASPGTPPARTRVKLTHPDRIYWPDAGVSKSGLADYYAAVWPAMATMLVDRPLSLVRCPGGLAGQCFFQKHAWQGAGAAIRRVPDPADPQGEPLLAVHDLDGLLALVQGGVLEVHPWGSTLSAIDAPDRLIFDLDPGEGVGWDAIVSAAREVRERLAAMGLAAFVKTSGGKGLHVVAPLRPKADWASAKAFSKAIAERMAADAPDRYVAVVTKAKRRGRILIDYLRNGRGATAVAAYSTRARPGATVSMPLAWEALGPSVRPDRFTVTSVPTLLGTREADPWEDFHAASVPLPEDGGASRRKGRRSARARRVA